MAKISVLGKTLNMILNHTSVSQKSHKTHDHAWFWSFLSKIQFFLFEILVSQTAFHRWARHLKLTRVFCFKFWYKFCLYISLLFLSFKSLVVNFGVNFHFNSSLSLFVIFVLIFVGHMIFWEKKFKIKQSHVFMRFLWDRNMIQK